MFYFLVDDGVVWWGGGGYKVNRVVEFSWDVMWEMWFGGGLGSVITAMGGGVCGWCGA